jgi:TonB-linked SusC/RagA family outer membrane protein
MQPNVFSQSKGITLSLNNATLKEVIHEIERITDYKFLYRSSAVNLTDKLSFKVTKMPVSEVLDKLFKNSDIEYQINGKQIVLKPKGTSEKVETQEKELIEVKGKILDQDGLPLPGATVMEEGTLNGTTSDIDGNYTLSADANSSLKISFIGFNTLYVQIEGNTVLNIVLEELASNLDEVVVTGYFSTRKQGFAGTITTFSQKEIKKVSTGNVLTTLAILDAGFKIHEDNVQGSDPNQISNFSIRGIGSFQNGSTQPIFIVDGFRTTAQYVVDMDPNRIKSMTILKDASATILYGSRAANGVIVIETIPPKVGDIRVTYDFRPTISFPDLNGYSLMNASQKLEYEKLAGLYIGLVPKNQLKLDKIYYQKYKAIKEGVNTYWLSQPVRTSFSQAHSIYVDGGVEQVRYGINMTYNNTQGVMKNSGNDRYNFGLKLIYRIAKKITIMNYAEFSYKKQFNSSYGNFSTYARLNPYDRFRDSQGELIPILSDGNPNPLYDASLPFSDNSKTQSFREQLSVDCTINHALRFKGKFNLTKRNLNSENFKSPFSSTYTLTQRLKDNSWGYVSVEKRGFMELNNGESLFITSNVTLQYNKRINKHTLFFGVGGEISYNSSKSHGFSVQGFPDDKYLDVSFAIQYVENTKPFSFSSKSKSVGAFFNGNYIYNDKYFVDISIRYDGSSKFGADNKFAPFWSVGAGWNIHKENFWNSKLFDELKIRYNYGVTGNQEFSAYQAMTFYNYNTDLLYNNTIPAILRGYGNPDLKWQEQYSHNMGLDIVMFKNKIRVNINYYKRRTTGMLTEITVAPSVGFLSGYYTANLGEIENKGIEFNLNAILLHDQARDIEWAIGIQASHNKNKLLKISDELKTINDKNNSNKFTPGHVYEEGESMTALKTVYSLGIDPATGQELFLKKDGKTVTSIWDAADKIITGDTEPTLFGNLSNNIFWQGWNLNMVFGFSFGADIYNQTLVNKIENVDPTENADVRAFSDRWKNPGDVTKYKRISDKKKTYISSRFVQKKNLIQLRTLSLSYQFKNEQLKKHKIRTLRLSFYANDLFRISSIKQERGIAYPFARSYVFRLNIGF